MKKKKKKKPFCGMKQNGKWNEEQPQSWLPTEEEEEEEERQQQQQKKRVLFFGFFSWEYKRNPPKTFFRKQKQRKIWVKRENGNREEGIWVGEELRFQNHLTESSSLSLFFSTMADSFSLWKKTKQISGLTKWGWGSSQIEEEEEESKEIIEGKDSQNKTKTKKVIITNFNFGSFNQTPPFFLPPFAFFK